MCALLESIVVLPATVPNWRAAYMIVMDRAAAYFTAAFEGLPDCEEWVARCLANLAREVQRLWREGQYRDVSLSEVVSVCQVQRIMEKMQRVA